MGIFDGGMFDLNGDGKVDLGEQFLAYKMFEDTFAEDDEGEDFSDELDQECDDDFFGKACY